jgi:hypothetical protein
VQRTFVDQMHDGSWSAHSKTVYILVVTTDLVTARSAARNMCFCRRTYASV